MRRQKLLVEERKRVKDSSTSTSSLSLEEEIREMDRSEAQTDHEKGDNSLPPPAPLEEDLHRMCLVPFHVNCTIERNRRGRLYVFALFVVLPATCWLFNVMLNQ